MGFKDQMKSDTAGVFLNGNEFAEQIMYNDKSIDALVIRKRIEPSGQNHLRSPRKQCEVYIANDPESGIVSVDIGNDTVRLPEYTGQSASDWVVEDIISCDETIWHILVGK